MWSDGLFVKFLDLKKFLFLVEVKKVGVSVKTKCNGNRLRFGLE